MVADKDWFGNVRKESVSNVYNARLSGIQLSNCPYAEEKTLRDVLCKCPNLYSGSMSNCSYGGSMKSSNIDKKLVAHYMRGDVTGFRGAPGDAANKGHVRSRCFVDGIRSFSLALQPQASQTAGRSSGRGSPTS